MNESDNKWKELDVSNLPPDILTGDYKFANGYGYGEVFLTALEAITNIMNSDKSNPSKYRYCKRQPKAPSHEEIMKPRFWQMDNPRYWRSITGFRNIDNKKQYLIHDGWCDVDFFIGRESADIPPEKE